MRIAVASKNPVKIEAVKEAFAEFFKDSFETESFSVSSGVSDQPLGNKETRRGAENRAKAVRLKSPDFDYYIGIEGGVSMLRGQMVAFAWMVILNGKTEGAARTASFFLPPRVAELVLSGYELGQADDMVFKKQNSKQQNGAVGLLTNNVVVRKSLYKQAIILALIPFFNPELYKKRI